MASPHFFPALTALPVSTLVLLLILHLRIVAGIKLPTCRGNYLDECGPNQACVVGTNGIGQCECKKNFTFNPNTELLDDACSDTLVSVVDEDTSHSATTVVVVLLMVFLIVVATTLTVRRYNLVNWVREKINRRDNSVMYEDVMIGQDDPPIAA